ncbi:hypothetical protein N7450_011844 [Penicillium hetheringtonii]|uniref:Zn(2)-C6 fungal-type domain-containing protein n=1 Tax=Penicillium hetheringtonii TaxID=911720 RepID=A0AAD6GM92_9EURO|nr:hypothetical protein N7450_011844 [Penicillium hetheringtonii]
MAVSQDEADRVLRLKSRAREAHACYPCRKRKVKCDGHNPCRTCFRRKHPHICSYQLAGPRETSSPVPAGSARNAKSSEGSGCRNVDGDTANDSIMTADAGGIHSDEASKNYVYSGDNSVVSILRLRASDAYDSVAREVGSVLGLQNTFNAYPFMDSKTPHERWHSLLEILPQRTEVLKFFHYYRITAYPFNPILADMDRFESDLCTYLNGHANGDFRDTDKIIDRWASDKSIGHISLLLATLAAGAHYSDIEYPQRLELTTDFARRSFHALRLANFLFRPSLDIIQALLIVGNTLQNMGQSDAAWALLGTTTRLAQTMGLHTERSTIHWPKSTIVWQDSLLCLCYDRPAIVSVSGWPLDNSFFERQGLSYTEIMHFLTRVGLDILGPEVSGIPPGDRAIEYLQHIDNVFQKSQPHLFARDNCTSLQQNLEHLALKMHTSFCALSVVPLRSWSMVHTVLSSTLLLCMWEETRNDPECRNLQQRVIDVFSASDSRSDDGSMAETDRQWLSARHIRALVTLRGALDREVDRPVEDEYTATGQNAPPFNGNFDSYFEMPNAFDISPVTYLDSIMNVPMFDFTQEGSFL